MLQSHEGTAEKSPKHSTTSNLVADRFRVNGVRFRAYLLRAKNCCHKLKRNYCTPDLADNSKFVSIGF